MNNTRRILMLPVLLAFGACTLVKPDNAQKGEFVLGFQVMNVKVNDAVKVCGKGWGFSSESSTEEECVKADQKGGTTAAMVPGEFGQYRGVYVTVNGQYCPRTNCQLYVNSQELTCTHQGTELENPSYAFDTGEGDGYKSGIRVLCGSNTPPLGSSFDVYVTSETALPTDMVINNGEYGTDIRGKYFANDSSVVVEDVTAPKQWVLTEFVSGSNINIIQYGQVDSQYRRWVSTSSYPDDKCLLDRVVGSSWGIEFVDGGLCRTYGEAVTFTTGPDNDGDGYRPPLDCNDSNGSIHPGAAETNNGLDDDCDGSIDEPANDDDNDGFREDVDCNDNNPNIHPGAVEVANGIDDDCDGSIDEPNTGTDDDGDGYVEPIDCNDSNAGINPGILDLTVDTVDQDCSGTDGNDAGTGVTPVDGQMWIMFTTDNPGANMDWMCVLDGDSPRPSQPFTDGSFNSPLTFGQNYVANSGETLHCNGQFPNGTWLVEPFLRSGTTITATVRVYAADNVTILRQWSWVVTQDRNVVSNHQGGPGGHLDYRLTGADNNQDQVWDTFVATDPDNGLIPPLP